MIGYLTAASLPISYDFKGLCLRERELDERDCCVERRVKMFWCFLWDRWGFSWRGAGWLRH